MTPRVIALAGTSNLRDIGGYPGRDGTTVRYGKLLRGEALVAPGYVSTAAIYNPDIKPEYEALGTRTIIDLRGAQEVQGQPNAWDTATGGTLFALPMDAGGEGDATVVMRALLDGSLKSFNADDLARFYAVMARDLAPVLGRALTLLAEPDRFPAIVHCMAGKDRTGMFIALLLDTLGTPREHVLTDYQFTEVLRPNRVDTYRDRLVGAGVDPDAVRVIFETPIAAMEQALAGIEAEFGSIEAYLTGPAQVAPVALDRLRAELLE